MAQIALPHGLNANLAHKWRRLEGGEPCEAAGAEFTPIAFASAQRGAPCVRMRWPATESAACVGWLRELLR